MDKKPAYYYYRSDSGPRLRTLKDESLRELISMALEHAENKHPDDDVNTGGDFIRDWKSNDDLG